MRIQVCVLFCFYAFSVHGARGEVVFSDGGDHTVDGLVTDFIRISDTIGGAPTTVRFNAGANITGTDPFDDTVFTEGTSRAIFNGGTVVDDVAAFDNSRIDINGGIFQDDVFALNNSTVNITGGSVTDDLTVLDNSNVTVSGGTFGEDVEVARGILTISGGQFATRGVTGSGFFVDGGGLISFFGTSFQVDGVSVGNGEIGAIDGLLSGTLLDGSTFVDIPFSRDPAPGGRLGRIQVTAVPEPSSALLLTGLTGILCLARQRRKKPQAV